MRKVKKFAIGVGVVITSAILIFVASVTIVYMDMQAKSQLLDEIIAECYEKYSENSPEFRHCRDTANDRWQQMLDDSS